MPGKCDSQVHRRFAGVGAKERCERVGNIFSRLTVALATASSERAMRQEELVRMQISVPFKTVAGEHGLPLILMWQSQLTIQYQPTCAIPVVVLHSLVRADEVMNKELENNGSSGTFPLLSLPILLEPRVTKFSCYN